MNDKSFVKENNHRDGFIQEKLKFGIPNTYPSNVKILYVQLITSKIDYWLVLEAKSFVGVANA